MCGREVPPVREGQKRSGSQYTRRGACHRGDSVGTALRSREEAEMEEKVLKTENVFPCRG